MGLSAEVVVLSIIFPLLSMAAVGLRLLSRRLKKLKLQADDYIIVPALVQLPPHNSIVLWIDAYQIIGTRNWHGNQRVNRYLALSMLRLNSFCSRV